MGKELAPNPPRGLMLRLGPTAVRAIAYAACSTQSHIGISSSFGAFRAHICQVALLVMRKTANVNMVTIQQSRSFRLESMIPSSLHKITEQHFTCSLPAKMDSEKKPYKWKDNSSKRYHGHKCSRMLRLDLKTSGINCRSKRLLRKCHCKPMMADFWLSL